jgi:hypothetical protein
MEILERNLLKELAKAKNQPDPRANLNTVWAECGSGDVAEFTQVWQVLESAGLVEGRLFNSLGKIRGLGKITIAGEQQIQKDSQSGASSGEHLNLLRNDELKEFVYKQIYELRGHSSELASALEGLTVLITRLEKRFPDESTEEQA